MTRHGSADAPKLAQTKRAKSVPTESKAAAIDKKVNKDRFPRQMSKRASIFNSRTGEALRNANGSFRVGQTLQRL